jgi:hypothetical protein
MFLAPQVLALSYLKEPVVLVNEIFLGLELPGAGMGNACDRAVRELV